MIFTLKIYGIYIATIYIWIRIPSSRARGVYNIQLVANLSFINTMKI